MDAVEMWSVVGVHWHCLKTTSLVAGHSPAKTTQDVGRSRVRGLLHCLESRWQLPCCLWPRWLFWALALECTSKWWLRVEKKALWSACCFCFNIWILQAWKKKLLQTRAKVGMWRRDADLAVLLSIWKNNYGSLQMLFARRTELKLEFKSKCLGLCSNSGVCGYCHFWERMA